ncbi:zonular occludens toxin domain-containing protein [Stenotrophobium rhamnosiphilum]|uniref:Zona occludens toxin N-terminal domain-containing protein n=1 Tax=Stenotrophobium rhamnosiphilum TaxID=2029166 RepID=A0A2T5MKC6_9GAMM|nr:zonular occludens toxin domain-containing protein [Stenotrophobium rhamnosiphilum]PTU33031.1 hypothetical protein CJD38_02675 [Stenotrophobium rhamnosiphilum]
MASAVINLVTGINGAGKTLWLLQHIEEMRKREGRKVYYFAINGIKEKGVLTEWEELQPYDRKNPELARLNDPMALWSLPQGAIILVDEAHKTFPNRKQGSQVPPWVEPFAEARHDGFTFFFVTQVGGDLDIFIRGRVGSHWHFERSWGMERSNMLQWEKYKNPNNDRERKDAKIEAFKFPKEVYDWYISSDDHQVKKTIPWGKLKWIVIYIGLAVICIVFAIHKMWNGVSKDEPKADVEKASETAQSVPTKRVALNATIDGPEWASKLKERIKGQPASAKMYDDTFKASTFPKISGCSEVIWDNVYRCTCNTQQGTTITTMSLEQCTFYVKNGWFDPSKPNGNDNDNLPTQGTPATQSMSFASK